MPTNTNIIPDDGGRYTRRQLAAAYNTLANKLSARDIQVTELEEKLERKSKNLKAQSLKRRDDRITELTKEVKVLQEDNGKLIARSKEDHQVILDKIGKIKILESRLTEALDELARVTTNFRTSEESYMKPHTDQEALRKRFDDLVDTHMKVVTQLTTKN